MDAVYQLFISSSTVFNKPLKIFRKAVELCRGNAYNNNMEKEVQNRITADIAAFRLPRYAQIPEGGFSIWSWILTAALTFLYLKIMLDFSKKLPEYPATDRKKGMENKAAENRKTG